MGSSPFTATISAFLSGATAPGDLLLVAFSGGVDSTALLAALQQRSSSFGVSVLAAHLDHALDTDSPRRRRRACELAAELGVPLISQRSTSGPPHGISLEDRARRERYRFLDRWADAFGARWIVTAHHADDQAETVLLRWLYGSGVEGLAGIRDVRGRLARPLLGVPRRDLRAFVDDLGLRAIEDPTNRDLVRPRNFLRHALLPRLAEQIPDLAPRLAHLADAARTMTARLDRLFERILLPRRLLLAGGVAIDRRAFAALPDPLRDHALKWLHRVAGAPLPASAAAQRELLRQIDSGIDAAGCDAGEGRRWECDALTVCLLQCESPLGNFAYTLRSPGGPDPGEIAIPELGLRLRLSRSARADWMLSGHQDRTGLTGLASAQHLEVRNRRPGDRLIPFGSRRRRKLKDLLIDRRVPRHQRDRLPLLIADGHIVWVPGVTIDDRFRLGASTADDDVWIAELLVERERSVP